MKRPVGIFALLCMCVAMVWGGCSNAAPRSTGGNNNAATNGSTTGASTTGASTTGTPGCMPPMDTNCAGVCRDVLTDPLNCGGCSIMCSAGSTCANGACACGAGLNDCTGSCVNLQSDPANCGACGTPCGAAQSCTAGACSCPAGSLTCGTACVDAQTDANNCGSCGTICAAGASCAAGACSCQAGRQDCGDGTCTDLNSSAANCGACGTACTATQVCSLGACADGCDATLTQCGQDCVDTNTDELNCGGCGTTCPGGRECVDGACACPAGQTLCGADCVDTQSNINHCGACNNACGGGTCAAGSCSCETAGQAFCNGACIDVQSDITNCGGCGIACGTGATCAAGVCECPAGQTLCEGACITGACDCPAGEELCADQCVPEGTCDVTSECDTPGMISDFENQLTTIADSEQQWSGEWEAFSDGAGTQTFEIEQVTDAACGQYALHTTGSGFTDYVGIGFALKGDPQAPDVYNGSQWTGIRFKAKGSSSMTPVRFNIPVPSTEGVGSGGQCPDGDSDCYNHPGRFLYDDDVVTTSWKTFHFCFDRDFYPQYLPSALSVQQRDNIRQNILKMQFIFNRAVDPNNSPTLYPMSTPFDLWVDDMEFTTDDCPAYTPSYTASGNKPYPQNQQFGSCTLVPNVERYNGAIVKLYEQWKERFVQSAGGGLRVWSPEDNRTISEAMGYGMLIAVSMGDRQAFDGMWTYVQSQLENGLMRWTEGGSGSATDADADIAYSLMLAQDQWGGSYGSAGSSMVGSMGADLAGSRINAGSNWGTQSVYNPSYFTPAYYDDFGGSWSGVVSSGYSILNSCNSNFGNAGNGLVPDWCNPDSGAPLSAEVAQVTSELCPPDCTLYAFDAARVPWRVGVDACVEGRSEATSYLNTLIGHFAGQNENGARIDLMRGGYQADGSAHPNAVEMQASFIGPVGVGAMGIQDSVTYQRAFRAVLDILESVEFNRTYYPSTVGLISLLEMSGNVPHR